MGQQQDVSGFIRSFAGSQRYVMDYLIEEVLQQQTGDVQDFLLKTSVLEKFTAPLCDAVTGRTDSRALLPALERANLLLVPLDESRQWFRYEHLFSDLLRHQLTKAAGEEDVAGLHRRAGLWFKENGLLHESIDHALAARDWEAAADLLAEVADGYGQRGEWVTLRAWLQALPEEILRTTGTLFGTYFFALELTGRLDEAEALLDRAEPMVGEDYVEHARITACRSIIESNRGNIVRSIELAQKALPLLSVSDVGMRGVLSVNLGVMYWGPGRFEQAEPLLWEGYRDAMKTGSVYLAMGALGWLADISRCRGNLSRSVELHEQALELAQGPPASAGVHLGLAAALYERNELESAMAHCVIGLDLNRLQGYRFTQGGLLSFSMLIATAMGDDARAQEATEQFDQLVARYSRGQVMYHMQLALRQGDLDEASRWVDRLMRLDGESPIGHLERLPLIRLLGILGRREEVAQQTDRLYQTAGIEPLAPEWKGWLITVRAAQALVASDQEEALGFLAEALRAGEPEGWIRSLVDMGPRLAPLLRKAVSQEVCPNYAAKLLTIMEAEQRRKADTGKSSRPSPIYAVLTERELEVLRLVEAGLSNRQIAGRLFISLGTVKVHLHNISEKLNTTSRTGAVARARELKLLQ